ncbi:MAG: hypothetical protein ACYC5U_09280 [Rhodocyclaceae bacterium]
MDINRVGKFEALKIVNAFDQALIEIYGINMTDAHITRYEVLTAYDKTGCPRKAAELFGEQQGLTRIMQSAA